MHWTKRRWITKHQMAVALAVTSGLLIYYLTHLVSESTEIEGAWLLYAWVGGTLLAALTFGFFNRRKPWQWGIYVLLGPIAFTALVQSGDSNQWPLGAVLYLVLLPPMLAAGALGGYLRKKLPRTQQ